MHVAQPGKVPAASIKLSSTAYSGNSYSTMTINWPRPNDAPSPGGLPSCVTDYIVQVYKVISSLEPLLSMWFQKRRDSGCVTSA